MLFKKNDINSRLHKAQKQMQPHALSIAANNGAKLDYSNESIQVLDVILPGITKELHEAGLADEDAIAGDEGAQGIAEALGCYVAECAERKLGKGEWISFESEDDEIYYGLKLPSGNTIMPINWVMKKLIDPEGYSINKVYEEFIAD